jgi:hypothetical protein
MNERARNERNLARAEAYVALGERHIARQIEIVAKLERGGHQDAGRYSPCVARDLQTEPAIPC